MIDNQKGCANVAQLDSLAATASHRRLRRGIRPAPAHPRTPHFQPLERRNLIVPVLDPDPTDGHKKLLQMAGLIAGLMVVLSIVATIADKLG